MTVLEALRAARAAFAASGIGSADLDAAMILGHVLGVPRHVLRTEPGRALTAEERARFDARSALRRRRCPMSHVLGRAEFLSMEFEVTEAVLSPRPETEALVEAVLAACDRVSAAGRDPVVVDVGTGSGCIPVAVAVLRPRAIVHTVDVSGPALLVAERNAARHGVAAVHGATAVRGETAHRADVARPGGPEQPGLSRVTFHRGDLVAPIATAFGAASVDVVVSNPPYVRRSEAGECDPEVFWEPACAVFCDGDPADLYARIAADAAPLVRPGGELLLELPGATSGPVVAAVRAVPGWCAVEVRPDLAGLPRVLRAVRGTG